MGVVGGCDEVEIFVGLGESLFPEGNWERWNEGLPSPVN